MKSSENQRRSWCAAFVGAGLLVVVGLTGCQVDVGGQTLPSPNYMKDDVQYFPPGPQMKLQNEAAAQQAARQEQGRQQQ
jgi:hypothetical protein